MINKAILATKILDLASVISAPASMVPRIGVANDFAYPYILLDQNRFFYIVRERGEVLEQRETSDLEDLLSWVFQDLTFQMATEFERKNRAPHHDIRRLLWEHQLQLLDRLRPEWRIERQRQIDQILKENPFSDLAG
jgi:hypothetical protein